MDRAFFVIVTTLLLATGSTIGCGGDEELPEEGSRAGAESAAAPPTPSEPAPVPTPAPTTERSPERDDAAAAAIAQQLSETIDLPSYYPEDGPVYPGAKPSQAQQAANGRVSLTFGADAPEEEAARIMTEASEAKGWRIESEDLMDRGRLTRASKDGRNLMILTNRVEGGEEGVSTLVAVSIDP